MINLAVMSDLHIGLAARAKDLCPEPAVDHEDYKKYNTKIENDYKQKFIEFVHREGVTADYLVLPGDITHRADPREVSLASEFILQAADALRVPHDKIIFTPGNHDVDWKIYDPDDTTGVRWGQRYDPLNHHSFYFNSIINQGEGSLLVFPHFTAWSFDGLFAVGYNSASHDSPAPKNAAHHGLCDPEHLTELCRYLNGVDLSDARIRLFLVHHHVFNFDDPIPGTPDFSLMTNAENLMSLLYEKGFDLLVHGHVHHPRFEAHSNQTYPHLPILCSGSFSSQISTEWAGTIDNQFHLVTISGRAGSENRITGKITSWNNNHSRGWTPSEEPTGGIHHIVPFGSYVMPNELDARLEPFISEWITTRDHITWKNITQEFPDLEHLPIKSAIAAFKRMEERLNLESMYETSKDLMLYRRI